MQTMRHATLLLYGELETNDSGMVLEGKMKMLLAIRMEGIQQVYQNAGTAVFAVAQAEKYFT